MHDFDPKEFVDQHIHTLNKPLFRLSREDMSNEGYWVHLLYDTGVVSPAECHLNWNAHENYGLSADALAAAQHIKSVLLRVGNGAYLDRRRITPNAFQRLVDDGVVDDTTVAFGAAIASDPVVESIVTWLLDDIDAKEEIGHLFEVDLMPLREALKSKFQLSSVVIHVQRGLHFPNHAAVHFCVARQGTAAWNGDEQLAIRTFIMAELNKYTEVKRRQEIEHEVRVEPKKLEGQWPYLRLVFSIVFSADAPQFMGVDVH